MHRAVCEGLEFGAETRGPASQSWLPALGPLWSPILAWVTRGFCPACPVLDGGRGF